MDGGTGGISVDGLKGGIPGGVEVSIPPTIPGGSGPVVLPAIPLGGGEINFTPTISDGGVGPIVIQTIVGSGGIPLTPSFPGGGIGPIVIPTLLPVLSGGNDGFVAGEQTITPLPPPLTRTASQGTLTLPVPSPTIPTDGGANGDNNGFVTPPM